LVIDEWTDFKLLNYQITQLPNMAEPKHPKPGFYKVLALVFLAIGVVLIWQALRRNEWLYWAFGIMTILNAIMSALKGLVPGETKH